MPAGGLTIDRTNGRGLLAIFRHFGISVNLLSSGRLGSWTTYQFSFTLWDYNDTLIAFIIHLFITVLSMVAFKFDAFWFLPHRVIAREVRRLLTIPLNSSRFLTNKTCLLGTPHRKNHQHGPNELLMWRPLPKMRIPSRKCIMLFMRSKCLQWMGRMGNMIWKIWWVLY